MTDQEDGARPRPARRRRRWGRVLAGLGAIAIALVVGAWSVPEHFVVLLSGPSDWEPVPIDGIDTACNVVAGSVPFRLCVHRTSGSASRDLVIHLHGRRGDATWWNDREYYTGEVHAAWLRADTPAPVVVGVSFGPLWLLTDESIDDAAPALLDVFDHEVMPAIERAIGFEPRRRVVVGESMGAVNALLVALRRPGRVDRVAALCPPLSTGSPFAGLAETRSLVAASSTTWQRAFMLRGLARHFFRSDAAWRRHDPVRLAGEASAEQTPELYLLCGRRDEWGCMEGSLALVEAARERDLALEWHPRDGGHCDVDPPTLARFLTR